MALSTLQRHLKRHGSGVGRGKAVTAWLPSSCPEGAEKDFPKGLRFGGGFIQGTTDRGAAGI